MRLRVVNLAVNPSALEKLFCILYRIKIIGIKIIGSGLTLNVIGGRTQLFSIIYHGLWGTGPFIRGGHGSFMDGVAHPVP